ncbi:cupin domain-containing protein [Acetobacteraceae bacterium H6797]|nr:cupin domain-containing protein [Acetobacteraceae bacterium H6797]
MSLIKTIDQNPAFEPKLAKPAPEKLISGDPSSKTWLLDVERDGKIRTGIWESTPGESVSMKGTTFEFCYLLEGVVELLEDGQEPKRYKAGDSFVMKPGFKGVWRTIETVKKIYVAADA